MTSSGWWPRTVDLGGHAIEQLYRWWMGWLFGHRLVVVTHVGRRSRAIYRTVLYVQQHNPRTGEVTVVSVRGDSDWLRNIRKQPAGNVQIARQSFLPGQRFLSTADLVDIGAQIPPRTPAHRAGAGATDAVAVASHRGAAEGRV